MNNNKCGTCRKYLWCAITSWIIMFMSGYDGKLNAKECPACDKYEDKEKNQ